MKKTLLMTTLSLLCLYVMAQVPKGINYQAVINNSAGAPVANATLQVKAAILSDTILPVVVWEELHSSVKTDASGVLGLVIGTGTKESGSAATFSAVDWSRQLFIRMQVYYQNSWKSLGSSKLWTVPYAMASDFALKSEQAVTAEHSLSADKLSGDIKKLVVTGETADMEEALFEVKNKDGQTVFAVYNEGVRIYVDDGAKGAKGGFAIGGFGTTKEASQDLLVVTPDCVRVYIDNKTDKGPKGGFAIGGFGTTKEPAEEYLRVTRDSTRIYLNDTISKGPKGGFAIGGFDKTKGAGSEYMLVQPENTRFYVRTLADQSSSTFNIIGLDQNQQEVPLLLANKDTIEVSGVLNLQNNLIVNGDVSVSGTVSQDSVIKDAEGNVYNTVAIGNQVWMKENLKATKYNDGTDIPNVTDDASWLALTSPAYSYYSNDVKNKEIYGNMYNWYAVSTGKLCPAGWHVPGDAEWKQLEMFLGMDQATADLEEWRGSNEGGKLKETGLTHWLSPNTGATDEVGFTALPGGIRWDVSPTFGGIGANASWWTATEGTPSDEAWYRGLYWDRSTICRAPDPKYHGFYVRCIKDSPAPTKGLVAYYPFNGNAKDESGNGNNGTITGASLTSDRNGILNKAYLFNNLTHNIEVPSSSTFFDLTSNEYTISGWFKSTDLSKTNQTIINSSPHGGVSIAFNYPTNDNKLTLFVHDGTEWNIFRVGGNFSGYQLNTWYSFVLVKTGLSCKVYVNGTLDISADLTTIPIFPSLFGFYLGQCSYINSLENLIGALDEVRIYNRALSVDEITALSY